MAFFTTFDSKKESWQTWCMRWTENPENAVRLREILQEITIVIGFQGTAIAASRIHK